MACLLLQPLTLASSTSSRAESTLVVADHDGQGKLNSATLNAIAAAKQAGAGDITCLVAGAKCADAAKEVAAADGVAKVLVAEDAALEGFLPERMAPLVLAAQKQFNFSHIFAPACASSRAILPAVAAKLDVSPISDIIGIKDKDTFVRTIYAGNAIMTLKSKDPIKVRT